MTSSPVEDEPASMVNPLVATLDETESKERQIPASEWTKTHDIVLMMDKGQLILFSSYGAHTTNV